MSRFDFPESYAINLARRSIRDSLMSHGEMSIAFSAYHPTRDPEAEQYRCSHYDDVYKDKRGDMRCKSCYNTSYTRFKEISRVWALYTDSPSVERQEKVGTWTPVTKNIQTEHFPHLMNGDYIVRVSYWNGKVPLVVEEVYEISEVKVESLRTGARFGQAYYDIVGQSLNAHKEPDTNPLYDYPFESLVL